MSIGVNYHLIKCVHCWLRCFEQRDLQNAFRPELFDVGPVLLDNRSAFHHICGLKMIHSFCDSFVQDLSRQLTRRKFYVQ